MKWLLYFIIFLFTMFPFIVLAYFVELRLFMVFPVLWFNWLFFHGIDIGHSQEIECIVEEV